MKEIYERHWCSLRLAMTRSANWKNNRAKAGQSHPAQWWSQCRFYMDHDFCAYSRAYSSVQNNLLSNYTVRFARTWAKILPNHRNLVKSTNVMIESFICLASSRDATIQMWDSRARQQQQEQTLFVQSY